MINCRDAEANDIFILTVENTYETFKLYEI